MPTFFFHIFFLKKKYFSKNVRDFPMVRNRCQEDVLRAPQEGQRKLSKFYITRISPRCSRAQRRGLRCPQAHGTDLGGDKNGAGSGIVSKFWGIKSGCSGIAFQIWAKLEFLKDFTHPKTWSPFRGIVSGFLFQSGQTGVRNVVPRWMWIWPYRLYCCDILVF